MLTRVLGAYRLQADKHGYYIYPVHVRSLTQPALTYGKSSCCRPNLITGRGAKAPPKLFGSFTSWVCGVKQMSSTVFISPSCSLGHKRWSGASNSAAGDWLAEPLRPFTCCHRSPHFPSGPQYLYDPDPILIEETNRISAPDSSSFSEDKDSSARRIHFWRFPNPSNVFFILSF